MLQNEHDKLAHLFVFQDSMFVRRGNIIFLGKVRLLMEQI